MTTAADYGSATTLVGGVFAGSASWWLALSSGVGFFREKFTPAAMGRVNKISGLVIGSFGIVALLGLINSGIS